MSLEEPGIYSTAPLVTMHVNGYLRLRSPFFPTALSITVPPVYDHRPGRFVKHIDFNHFRTIGMRRSLEEGVASRFVTAERLGVILKVSPNQQRPQFGSILMSSLPSLIRRHPT